MIKATELRIGNYIGAYDRIFRVEQIRFEVLADGVPLLYEEMEPIPLTPEILEKAGFYEEDVCFHASMNYNFELYLNPGMGDYHYRRVDGHATSVTTLHQLQNLYFALTGEELKIDL